MNTNLTDITIVVDRSGSMQNMASESSHGINQLIKDQTNQPGEAVVTLYEFNNASRKVFGPVSSAEAPEYQMNAVGNTALLDALGAAINDTGKRLSEMQESDRPGKVVFVIVTDGEENASRRFTRGKIRDMIQHQESKYGWGFQYLGANQDAFREGAAIGISPSTISGYSVQNTQSMYNTVSKSLSRARQTSGAIAQSLSFTDSERASLV